jgi:hypothetical protein
VKSYIAMAALAGSVLVFSACDSGGDGTLESCATSLLGTFEGDKTGPITATLTATLTFDGELKVLFAPDGEATPRDTKVTVSAESGEIIPGAGALQLTGSMDFYTCEVEGEWTLFGADSGTWHIGIRRHSSF